MDRSPIILIFVLDGPKIIFKTTEPTKWVIYKFGTNNALEAINIMFDYLNMHQNNDAIFHQDQGRKMVIYFEYPEELVQVLNYPLPHYSKMVLEVLQRLHYNYFLEVLTIIKTASLLVQHEEGSSSTDLTENNNSQQENRNFRFGHSEEAHNFCDDKNNKNDATIVVLADERMAGQLTNLMHRLYEAQLATSITVTTASVSMSLRMRQPSHSKSTSSNKQDPEASQKSKKTKETKNGGTSNPQDKNPIVINSPPETTNLRKPVARKEETVTEESKKKQPNFPRNPGAGRPMRKQETDVPLQLPIIGYQGLVRANQGMTHSSNLHLNEEPVMLHQVGAAHPQAQSIHFAAAPTNQNTETHAWTMNHPPQLHNAQMPGYGGNQPHTSQATSAGNIQFMRSYQAQSVHLAAASTIKENVETHAWTMNHPLLLHNAQMPGYGGNQLHTPQATSAGNIQCMRSYQAQSVHMAGVSSINANVETHAWTMNHPLLLHNAQMPGYGGNQPHTPQATSAGNIQCMRSYKAQSVHMAGVSSINENVETHAWTMNHPLLLHNAQMPGYRGNQPHTSQATSAGNIQCMRSYQAQSVHMAGVSSINEKVETHAWTMNHPLLLHNAQMPGYGGNQPHTPQATTAGNIQYMRSYQAQSVQLSAASSVNENVETQAWTVNHPLSLNNPEIPGYGENHPNTQQQRVIQAGTGGNLPLMSSQAQLVHSAAAPLSEYAEAEALSGNHDREIQDWVARNISILMKDGEEIVASLPPHIAAWARKLLFSILNTDNTTEGC